MRAGSSRKCARFRPSRRWRPPNSRSAAASTATIVTKTPMWAQYTCQTRCRMRAVPSAQPALSNTRPKASAEATPEQKTKISVASEKPKRAGIQSAHAFPGIWAARMMSIPTPRKTSSRGSRGRLASGLGTAIARSIFNRRSGRLLAPFDHGADHETEDDVATAGRPGERDEVEEGGQPGDQMRHDVKREDPQPDAEARRGQVPGQPGDDQTLERAGDEQIPERVEQEADEEMDNLADEPAFQPEHRLHEGRGLERAADARNERRDHARPELPGQVGGDAGDERRDHRLGVELRKQLPRHRAGRGYGDGLHGGPPDVQGWS